MSSAPCCDRCTSAAAAALVQRVRATSTAGRRAADRWATRLGPEGARVAALAGAPKLFGDDAGPDGPASDGALSVPLPAPLARRWAAAVGADRIRLLATLVLVAGAVTSCYERRDDLLVGVVTETDGLLPVRVDAAPTAPDGRSGAAAWLTAAVSEVDAALVDADWVPADARELVAEGIAVALAAETDIESLPAPLLLVADRDGEVLRLSLRHRADVAPEMAARVSDHLAVAARDLLGPDRRPPGELDLLGRAERQRLERLHGPDDPSWPEPALLPDRVREQARRRPDALALVWPGTETPAGAQPAAASLRLSYAQLVHATDALGVRLAEAGLQAGDRVAILLERGPAVVVAALACLDHGLCYLPLDPAHPSRRLRALIEEARANAVVTQTSLLMSLEPGSDGPHGAAVVVVPVDVRLAAGAFPTPETTATPEVAAAPLPRPDAATPAYAIYTSGSTGTPKAVLVTHGAYAATCEGYSRRLGLDEPGAVPVELQLAAFTFDVFCGGLARTLYHGGTLVLCPDELRTDAEAVAELIVTHQVSLVEATPALVNPLADILAARGVPSHLRTVLCGSDSWASGHAARVRAALGPDVALYNTYGVTEAAIDSTYYPVTELPSGLPTAPIGSPLARVRLLVLDHHGRAVPPGIPGELYIAGPTVATGYLGRPELTADRFGTDPETGARWYRTGDLVRLGRDGAVQFLGRIDNQLKVNGVRVEPEEIEQVLREHPEVGEAVVLAVPGPAGMRLVGYLAPADVTAMRADAEEPVAPAGLRDYCRERLPAGLVPSAFVALHRLPLSANGKLDRSALPAPRADAGRYAAPRTELERLLARLWSDELGQARIGRDDDFFALGGQSLAAARTLSQLHRATGVRLSLRVLFDAPTVAGLAAAATGVAGAAAVAAVAAVADATGLTMPPAALDAPAAGYPPEPIAPAQARLWFLEQMHPGTTSYTVPIVLRLTGPLDVQALQQCLDAWVRRHDALRTTYRQLRGEPVAVVGPAGEGPLVPLASSDVRGTPDADGVALGTRPVEVLDPVRAVLDTPFDLQSGPVLRAGLVRVTHDSHVLVVAVHHLACDGTSVTTLLRELVADYPLAAAGGGVPPIGPQVSYAEFSRWQRAAVQSGRDADVAFWRDRLAGVPDLVLPYDTAPTGLTPPPARRCSASLPGGALETLARAHATTPFVLLVAAVQAALWRWCGQDRFAVGTAASGRVRPEFDDVVGFFVTTVALPADLSERPNFTKLVEAAHRSVRDAHSHEQTPFDHVVSALGRAGDAAVPPVFQVCLTVEDTRTTSRAIGSLAVAELQPPPRTARFDLTLDVTVSDDGYQLTTIYAADRFERVTVERWQRSLLTMLDAALEDPGRRVADLPFVHPDDRAQQRRWGTGPAHDAGPGTVHGLVLERARQQPDAIAIIAGERRVSYAELVSDAAAIAQALPASRERPSVDDGAAAGDESAASVVAVCLPRGAAQLTAVLAVLISGHAYLPLEPDLPTERAVALARDANARALLTSAELRERFAGLGVPVLEPFTAPPGFALPPPPEPGPDYPAYVMYTSGSTGTPKGVLVGHDAVDNRLSWGAQTYPSHPDDRFLFKTAFGFDISVTEMFWPLRGGNTLVIAEPGGQRDPAYLSELVRSHRITTVHFVPSLLGAFLQEPSVASCRGIIRRVFCSGEMLPEALLARCREILGVPVHNQYGPTETTIEVTAWDPEWHPGRPVAIGRPVRNSWVRVLDERLRELPIGAPGELCVGGRQLALGYLGQPGLTAQRFITAPDGERMYRTGDQVRWGSDGELLWLGRLDDQVKIDGRRVELGEISATLEKHPDVAAAAVVFRPDRQGPGRLVGYYVPRTGDAPEDLHAYLRSRLPEYMTPVALLALDRLPMTSNGKLDRAALPEPSERATTAAQDYLAPRTARETEIAQVWARVLRLDRVGAHDDFFALGGHSLLAIRMLAELSERTGARVPVLTLFDGPTVAGLARAVDELTRAGASAAPDEHAGRARPVPRRHERSRYRAVVADEPAPTAGKPR